MKFILLSLLILTSFSSFASAKTKKCQIKKSQSAVVAMEQLNGHKLVETKVVELRKTDVLTTSKVESYTGVGGAVYTVTFDGCQVIKTEMLEEIDR